MRSIGSSAIGQFFFTFIAMWFDLYNMVPNATLLQLIMTAYLIKLAITPLAVFPVSVLAIWLKAAEGVDAYDYGVSYNPFRLSDAD